MCLCVLQGERSFFLQPGEHLEQGIQDVYVMSEEEGLVLRAVEAFHDLDQVRLSVFQSVCPSAYQQPNYFLLHHTPPLLLLYHHLWFTPCSFFLLLPLPPFSFVILLVLFSSFFSFTSFAVFLLPASMHRHVNPCLPPPPPTPPLPPLSALPLPGQR